MLDAFMHNTFPVWMLVSAAYPIFVILFVGRTVLRYRRLRALIKTRETQARAGASVALRTEAEDWIPSR